MIVPLRQRAGACQKRAAHRSGRSARDASLHPPVGWPIATHKTTSVSILPIRNYDLELGAAKLAPRHGRRIMAAGKQNGFSIRSRRCR